MTAYKYEYYLISQKWPNMNTNITRFPKNDRIRIRILFGFPKPTEYEYKYYSASQKLSNKNTNIIQFPKNDRIQIRMLFGYSEITEYDYEYYLATQKWPNTNIIRLPNNNQIQISFGFPKMNKFENKFCSASQKEGLQYQFWVSQGDAKFAESSDDCS